MTEQAKWIELWYQYPSLGSPNDLLWMEKVLQLTSRDRDRIRRGQLQELPRWLTNRSTA